MFMRFVLIWALAVGGFAALGGAVGGTGAPLYPDLRTRPPADLRFDRLADGTHVLRFANTVWNAGEGRLEIQGNPKPPRKKDRNVVRQVYQNLYDAPVSGALVGHKQVASDAVYHPNHQHFHFADFASYLLLQRDAGGAYQPTAKKGTKTSFCIMDTDHVQGTYPDQYWLCGGELQGLTPGWGDTYDASLADQWVVLGSQRLADGEYAVQSTADPRGLLNEGGGEREANNASVRYFAVSNGAVANVRNQP
jgi:hypothetical protein